MSNALVFEMLMAQGCVLSSIAVLSEEYGSGNITAERFAKRCCELMAEHGKLAQDINARIPK